MTDDTSITAAVFDAIRVAPADNVATVLRPIARGEHVRVRCDTTIETVVALEAIPLCHKLCLTAISPADAVVKYGEPIGEAIVPIRSGMHVHVHNLRSRRGRARPAELAPPATRPRAAGSA